MTKRIYLGYVVGRNHPPIIFKAEQEPTFASHGDQYAAVVGPFQTMRGAEFMQRYGQGNPHCRSVYEAERLAAGKSYDIALGKWVERKLARRA